jgi:hypothetical protein
MMMMKFEALASFAVGGGVLKALVDSIMDVPA